MEESEGIKNLEGPYGAGREDMCNLLLLVCYKGGALWNHIVVSYSQILLIAYNNQRR